MNRILKKWFPCNEIHERLKHRNHSLLCNELSYKSAIPYQFGIAYGLKPGDTTVIEVSTSIGSNYKTLKLAKWHIYILNSFIFIKAFRNLKSIDCIKSILLPCCKIRVIDFYAGINIFLTFLKKF